MQSMICKIDIIINTFFAAVIHDVHSLFFVREEFSSSAHLVMIQVLLSAVATLILVNVMFDFLRLENRIRSMESFFLEKFRPHHKPDPIQLINPEHFKSCMLEDNLVLGGKKVEHKGLYLLSCPATTSVSISIVNLMQEIIKIWKRPIIYFGKQESSLLEPFLSLEEKREEEIRRIDGFLSSFLYTLPVLTPGPEQIRFAVEKLTKPIPPGAVIIEDVNYQLFKEFFENEEYLVKLFEISCVLRVPIFLLGTINEGSIVNHILNNPRLSKFFFLHGEIRIGKENEIYVIPPKTVK